MRLFRRFSYEIFLRLHQGLAGYVLFAVWKHVDNTIARYYVLGILGLVGFSTMIQTLLVLVTHRFFFYGWPRAVLTLVGDAVHMKIKLPVSLKVRAGQHINLWMPGISLRSSLQSHPFVVTSAIRDDSGTSLELIIEPRHGWTANVLSVARNTGSRYAQAAPHEFITLFGGPYGASTNLSAFGVVVMVASGWGVIAQVPLLQNLINQARSSTSQVRHIHLIWQIDSAGEYTFELSGTGLIV